MSPRDPMIVDDKYLKQIISKNKSSEYDCHAALYGRFKSR